MSENIEDKYEQIPENEKDVPEGSEVQEDEEFVFDEKPVQPKWFKNKVVNIFFIIGVIIIICLAVYFVRKVWPDVVNYFKERRLYQEAVRKDESNDMIIRGSHYDSAKEALAGHAVYFELIGPVGLVCVLVFVVNYLIQVAAKKMQDARRKSQEKKFYKEKEKRRKEREEAVKAAKG